VNSFQASRAVWLKRYISPSTVDMVFLCLSSSIYSVEGTFGPTQWNLIAVTHGVITSAPTSDGTLFIISIASQGHHHPRCHVVRAVLVSGPATFLTPLSPHHQATPHRRPLPSLSRLQAITDPPVRYTHRQGCVSDMFCVGLSSASSTDGL
jgi:hypothetical protein